MTVQELFKQEYLHEAPGIIKTLERVDFAHADWKPHEKSMSLLNLAIHVAELCDWAAYIIAEDTLDFATANFTRPTIENSAALAAYAQEKIDKSIAAFDQWKDDDLQTLWTLKHGEHILMQAPKAMAIRTICQNHIIHHRAQLTVYLRELNIPVPGLYGPSADEK